MPTANSWYPTRQRAHDLASSVPNGQLSTLIEARKIERAAHVTADMLGQLVPASGTNSAARWQACLEHPMFAQVAHEVVSRRVGGIIDARWRATPLPYDQRTGRG